MVVLVLFVVVMVFLLVLLLVLVSVSSSLLVLLLLFSQKINRHNLHTFHKTDSNTSTRGGRWLPPHDE